MKRGVLAVALGLALGVGSDARSAPDAAVADAGLPSQVAFEAATRALFNDTCAQCHNSVDADGGFDVGQYSSVASLTARREGWEGILGKLRSGEMPPSGIPRPQQRIDELLRFLDTALERIDENAAPDPGRVTLRRLNRTEYTNTIRDLLGLEFRADRSFPADDSGEGFDNIGDVLSVSPVLMEKYMAAAERIAARALGTEPLPPPIKTEYHLKFENLRRIDRSTLEATHHADFDGEYELVVGFQGQRPEGKPVELGVWVDGKLARSVRVETKPTSPVFIEPYSEERVRVALPEGDHRLRAGFVRDAYLDTLPEAGWLDRRRNKWVAGIAVVGPFPSKGPALSRKRVLVCEPASGPACVERILSRLAQRAYRRPVSKAELAELTRFVSMATADGASTEQGIALALQAMLVSPHFLFHVERERPGSGPSRSYALSDVELASRLSYFLWSSMPDDELLGEAMRGRLSQPEVFDAQVTRLLKDPKSSALAENFAGQWLEIRNLDSIKPDPDRFPAWTPELKQALRAETQAFFTWLLERDRPIGEFIDARYTFLNEQLAEYYGIPGVRGPELRRVRLDTEQRGGILSQGSVLAVSSYPTRTSVVIRGKYVLQNILGAPPPPPPADVPPLDEQAVATSASLREQMEQHRSNPVCASCHARMDPLGFGLENYDAIGRWRGQDGGLPIDASGVLPGGEAFSSPAELRHVLRGMLPDFARCLTEKLLTYALGRGLGPHDKPAVRSITQHLAASNYRFQVLVHEVVRSLPFRSRRVEASVVAAGGAAADATLDSGSAE